MFLNFFSMNCFPSTLSDNFEELCSSTLNAEETSLRHQALHKPLPKSPHSEFKAQKNPPWLRSVLRGWEGERISRPSQNLQLEAMRRLGTTHTHAHTVALMSADSRIVETVVGWQFLLSQSREGA